MESSETFMKGELGVSRDQQKKKKREKKRHTKCCSLDVGERPESVRRKRRSDASAASFISLLVGPAGECAMSLADQDRSMPMAVA